MPLARLSSIWELTDLLSTLHVYHSQVHCYFYFPTVHLIKVHCGWCHAAGRGLSDAILVYKLADQICVAYTVYNTDFWYMLFPSLHRMRTYK